MTSKLYLTTTIPYVNAQPHVGFALELVQADVLARYHRLVGREVCFQTGTDENAIKNVLAAEQRGVPVQTLVDENAGRFRALLPALNISADAFVRTSEAGHRDAVQAFWRALKPEDLERRRYTGLYCPGCEDFYLPRDLADGLCPEHRVPPVEVAEENVFFRLSAYQRQIEQFIETGRLAIVPASRRNEVLAFVKQGLCDFSITRSEQRASGWGTRVPGAADQVVYVWVDALVNYLSGRGFGRSDDWATWWSEDIEKLHLIGKNVWKFHAVYWPALLLSAELPLPDRVIVHGFLTVEGRKIGKSLGNAVDPFAVIDEFGVDALRYYLLKAVPPFDDGDFSRQRLADVYRTELADGLGNLVSRLATLCDRSSFGAYDGPAPGSPPEGFAEALTQAQFDRAVAALWRVVVQLNRQIEASQPWTLLEQPQRLRPLLAGWLADLRTLAHWLAPLLPETAQQIEQRLFRGPIAKVAPLFPRLPA